jgi:hypothetical protein
LCGHPSGGRVVDNSEGDTGRGQTRFSRFLPPQNNGIDSFLSRGLTNHLNTHGSITKWCALLELSSLTDCHNCHCRDRANLAEKKPPLGVVLKMNDRQMSSDTDYFLGTLVLSVVGQVLSARVFFAVHGVIDPTCCVRGSHPEEASSRGRRAPDLSQPRGGLIRFESAPSASPHVSLDDARIKKSPAPEIRAAPRPPPIPSITGRCRNQAPFKDATVVNYEERRRDQVGR